MIAPEHRRADRCPGLLTPHPAEDGMLVRIRVPGGRVPAATLRAMSDLAADHGQPELQITSRGNVQLRGIDPERLDELSNAATALGLLPSAEHERVRNIIGSPLAGLAGRPDISRYLNELDLGICADPQLAGLPGRFLFAIDDGRGDLAGLRFDLGARWLGGHRWLIMIDSATPVGLIVESTGVVPTMIMIARRFVALRQRAVTAPWHLRELRPEALGVGECESLQNLTRPLPVGGQAPLGAISGAASVSVPLARLTHRQTAALADAGDVVLTPWRGVVVPGAADRLADLAATGLIIDERSVWNGLTACVGSPGCRRSAIDTRNLATELADLLPARSAIPVHVSGCERRCGAPAGDHHDLMAPADAGQAFARLTDEDGER